MQTYTVRIELHDADHRYGDFHEKFKEFAASVGGQVRREYTQGGIAQHLPTGLYLVTIDLPTERIAAAAQGAAEALSLKPSVVVAGDILEAKGLRPVTKA
jgi:hypothetical protein